MASFITNSHFSKKQADIKDLKLLTSYLFKYYEEHNEEFDDNVKDKITVKYL